MTSFQYIYNLYGFMSKTISNCFAICKSHEQPFINLFKAYNYTCFGKHPRRSMAAAATFATHNRTTIPTNRLTH
uniref:Uncharacterized protein n=1 Tax=Anopheles stephensi TaxID=30069 RepID=A0A182YRD9_ANOST